MCTTFANSQFIERTDNRWFSAMLILLAIAVLSGCGLESSQSEQLPPPSVVVETARLTDVTPQRTFTGRVEAIDTGQIRARVQGYLNKRAFEEGAEVTKGQLLFNV